MWALSSPPAALAAAVAGGLAILGACQAVLFKRRAAAGGRPLQRVTVSPHEGRTVRIDLETMRRPSGAPWRMAHIAARSPTGARLRKTGAAKARGVTTDAVEVDFPVEPSSERPAPRVFLELPMGVSPRHLKIQVAFTRDTGEVYSKVYRAALPPRLFSVGRS